MKMIGGDITQVVRAAYALLADDYCGPGTPLLIDGRLVHEWPQTD
jgi:hypothetical protein